MKYLDEFRDPSAAKRLVDRVLMLAKKRTDQVTFMEVCGTHTMSIYRHGIRNLLPSNVRMLSGPGCPVCVTPNRFLDRALALARLPGFIITTFGDMIRVPGSTSSLQQARAEGCDVRIVYSTLDALRIARENPDHQVVFLGVGFETTAPTVGAAILEAHRTKLKNFSVLAAAKVIPPAMEALVSDQELRLDGFLCPGHVSVIIGAKPYAPLATEHGLPCVIAGFEALDILQGIVMLLEQVNEKRSEVAIAYRRAVSDDGNPAARKVLEQAFELCDAEWRGIGTIPASGLTVHRALRDHDALRFEVEVEPTRENPACACGEILRGLKSPVECKLFGNHCTPDNPQGACMVSSEGTCAAAYRYGRTEDL